MPTPEEREANVKSWYATHDTPTVDWLKKLDWTLIDAFGGIAGKRVLNIGPCAPKDEVEFGPFAKSWHALDFVPEVIERGRAAAPNATWTLGDARQMPYEDAAFDIVLALSTIEHIPLPADRTRAHCEAARVLVPHGLYVLVYSNRLLKNGLRALEQDGDYGFERNHLLGELVDEVRPAGMSLVHYQAGAPFEPRVGTVWVKGEWVGC